MNTCVVKTKRLAVALCALLFLAACGEQQGPGESSTVSVESSEASEESSAAEPPTGLLALVLPEGTPYGVHPNLPDTLQDEIRRNRVPYLTRVDGNKRAAVLAAIAPGATIHAEEDALTAKEALASTMIEADAAPWLEASEVTQELELLRRLLKYGLAEYAYFGGDEAFDPVFSDMAAEIAAAGGEQGVPRDVYAGILQKNLLPLLQDRHSFIDGKNYLDMSPKTLMHSYCNEAYSFVKSGDSFVTAFGNEKLRLETVNGEAPEAYLYPTILEDGTIAFIPWAYAEAGTDGYVSYALVLSGDGGVRGLDIRLERVEPAPKDDALPYSLREEESYYTLRNSSLQDEDAALMSAMAADAAGLVGTKPIIMDLLGHGGGNSMYALGWVTGLLGATNEEAMGLPNPLLGCTLSTRTTDALFLSESTPKPVGESALVTMYDELYPLHLQNNTPIFVLMDRRSGSSGEWFISYLRRLDNVVLVGENTGGWLIGGNTVSAPLPKSRVWVSLSTLVGFDSDLANREGVGFAPDLYVPPAQAAERVAAMIEQYGIGKE